MCNWFSKKSKPILKIYQINDSIFIEESDLITFDNLYFRSICSIEFKIYLIKRFNDEKVVCIISKRNISDESRGGSHIDIPSVYIYGYEIIDTIHFDKSKKIKKEIEAK